MSLIPDPSLDAGETALSQGDYATAIAHFQGVCEIEIDFNTISRAQQALVVAYTQSGKIQAAIDLCESLIEQTWAQKTLADLLKRYPESANLATPKIGTSQLPSIIETPSTQAQIFTPGRQWRNAERAKSWQLMKPLKMWRLWLVEAFSILILFWLFRFSIQAIMQAINWLLLKLPLVEPIPLLERDPTNILIGFLIIIFVASPWLLDLLLTRFYGLKSLKFKELANQAPEAARVIQRYCKQKHIALPNLKILPTFAPVAFSYGNLPRNVRIVITEGLLVRLDQQELATIYATQLGQIKHQDCFWMSGIITFLQISYTLYWQTAKLGDKLTTKLKQVKRPQFIPQPIWQYLPPLNQSFWSIIAAIFYGLYWLWRVPVLWFSRWRCYYSDRFGAELTGNPNALSRALLKIAIGIADQVKFQGYTNWLLEGFDLILPLGLKQAIIIGNLPEYTPYESVLAWECTNPYRHWLAQINAHPLLGDRLYLLGRYAYFWKIQPELDLPTLRIPPKDNRAKFIKIINCYQALPILQSAFLSGLIFGIIFRNLLRIIGIISDWLNIWRLIWLTNASPFLNACILFAFSLSIIIWINGYFPDIKSYQTRQEPRLQDLLADENAVPPKSNGIRITGKLLGREGISNWLSQDLILQTETGLVKLHYYSWLGIIGNLFAFFPHPEQFVNQEVTVWGWFRRGSTPWIDVDRIETKNKQTLHSGYPIWVTILAVGAAIIGAYLIIEA